MLKARGPFHPCHSPSPPRCPGLSPSCPGALTSPRSRCRKRAEDGSHRLSPGRAGGRGGRRAVAAATERTGVGVARRGPRGRRHPEAVEGRRLGARPRARSSGPPGLGACGSRRAQEGHALPRGARRARCGLLPVRSGGLRGGEAGKQVAGVATASRSGCVNPTSVGRARQQLGKGMPFLSPARTPPPRPLPLPHVSALPGPPIPGSCPTSCCHAAPLCSCGGDGFQAPLSALPPGKGREDGGREREREAWAVPSLRPSPGGLCARVGAVTAPTLCSTDQGASSAKLRARLPCSGHAPSSSAPSSLLSLPFQPSPPLAVLAYESPSVFPGIFESQVLNTAIIKN